MTLLFYLSSAIILIGAMISVYHLGNLSYDKDKKRAAALPAFFLFVAAILIVVRFFVGVYPND